MDDPSSVTQPIRDHTDSADRSEADSAQKSGAHLFDQALALARVKTTDHRAVYEGQVHPSFKNINDPYGGWSAAVLARAILDTCDPELELVSLTTDYLSVPSGGRLQIDVDCDRSGRRTEFWRAVLTGRADTSPANRAIAILARRRDTLEWTEGSSPDVPPPEDCHTIDLPMAWNRVIEIKPTMDFPMSMDVATHFSSWVRFTPGRALDSVALVALADTPMPRLFQVIGRQESVATVSMTVYLHATSADYAAVGDDYLLVDTRGARGGRGFYDQHATIWSRDGRLLVTTQQIVWYRTAQ
ncbi:MAG: thioesterase family protein [Pseudomonadota bacterium]|nr:thioesterase family protein [Pseudomonadota bacterium]MEC8889388.1 thioesterase family protein [Pseudomonadota bacterium]MED5391505.1 thioesterase family protein [Pseudomonadota bacterium]